jgi:hypothetical protein
MLNLEDIRNTSLIPHANVVINILAPPKHSKTYYPFQQGPKHFKYNHDASNDPFLNFDGFRWINS